MAVENHLLVALPKDGTLGSCKMLLRELQKDATNAWFNSESRCRHLTVGAVKELPLLDVAPDWVHPGNGLGGRQLLRAADQTGVRVLPD